MIIKKKGAYNDGLTDKEMLDLMNEIDDKGDNDSKSASGDLSHADMGNEVDESGGKKHDATCDTVRSKHITDNSAQKDDRNAVKQDDDMTSDTVDSRDKTDSSARQYDRNAVEQDDENEADNGPDLVKRQILQDE